MRPTALVFVMLIVFFPFVSFAQTGTPEAEELEMSDIEEVTDTGHLHDHEFLGISKHRWLSISGPVVWVLMVLAIGTRHVKIGGKAKQLLRLHKIFAYAAFVIATGHGIFGLFF